jgi:hypothetical protein
VRRATDEVVFEDRGATPYLGYDPFDTVDFSREDGDAFSTSSARNGGERVR